MKRAWKDGETDSPAEQQDEGIGMLVDKVVAAPLGWDRDDFEATIAAVNEGYADVEAGRSRPAAEVLQDLRHRAKALAVRQSIQEGLDSGTSDRTVNEIWAEAEARFKTCRNT